jgi:hypothetical protein
MNNDNENNPTPTLPRFPTATQRPEPISQLTEQAADRGATASPENFDEEAEIEDAEGGWTFPDPALFPTDTPQPLARTRGQQQRMLAAQATATPARGVEEEQPAPSPFTPDPGQPAPPTTVERAHPIAGQAPTQPSTSALIQVCEKHPLVKTTEDIKTFLAWQASRRGETEEQKRFRDDAAGYSTLLVFAAMRKKSPHIHLIHSAGIYPNVPGADRDWCGKCIGFLGDRTKFATPQLVELGKTTAWGWEEHVVCVDDTAMAMFYAAPDNAGQWWTPEPTARTEKVACPRMLALPPDCVVFCAQARRTPAELLGHVTQKIQMAAMDPRDFQLVLDWCCMAAQPGTGTNAASSMLAFATPAILGTSEHFHSWAHARLLATLGPIVTEAQGERQANTIPGGTTTPTGNAQGPVDVGLIAQVTAAVVAALRAEGQASSGESDNRTAKTGEAAKPYSEYQLAKLKGYSCVRSESLLQPIWTYFKENKEVDAQRTQLMEEMRQWARRNDVQINRSIYFEKATMDDITKMDFGPGTPTAHLHTAEQGISILTCRPRNGSEAADLRTKEQAVNSTHKNHTLAEALLLGKRDPRPPASTFHELKLDVGTFCALLWVLFGDKCDFYDNCYALFTMLDSESVTANGPNFTPTICRQITWAILNDSRQYFFHTVTVDNFASGQVRWPNSLLMQIIGADVHACREIQMGNFPAKWRPTNTPAINSKGAGDRGTFTGAGSNVFVPPLGVPPQHSQSGWGSTVPATDSHPERTQSASADRPVNIRQSDIHPTLKALMAPYITHFRSIQLRNLLRAANITEQNLPTLPQYLENGRNNLCYSYILGKCQGRACGRASNGHAPASAISNEFAQTLCDLLAPGVQKRLATEPPTTLQSYQQGNPAKRWKRSA